jgi:hypothetical protein
LGGALNMLPALGIIQIEQAGEDVKAKTTVPGRPPLSALTHRAGAATAWPQFMTAATDQGDDSLNSWLRRVGLEFNPFAHLDAGDDPNLSTYLIGSNIFEDSLWGDWHSFLFAPSGGGKTAFRVRLAHECRVGGDRRRVFPIVYQLPQALDREQHLLGLGRAAATELLLELAYQPQRFESLTRHAQAEVKAVLDENAPNLLAQFLPQLVDLGSPLPIIEYFDRSASHLPNLPDPARVRHFVAVLQRARAERMSLAPIERFEHLLTVIQRLLGLESIYILLDGADGYFETARDPHAARRWIEPMLAITHDCESRSIFLKAFLPDSLLPVLETKRPQLTSETKWTKISWRPDQLIDILRMRIRVASGGEFDNLDAISDPGLRHIERTLVEKAQPLPREVLALANHLFIKHSRRRNAGDHLEQIDLRLALLQYDPKQYPLRTDSL